MIKNQTSQNYSKFRKFGALSILATILGGAGTFAKGFMETVQLKSDVSNLEEKVQLQGNRIIILETKEQSSSELLKEVRDDVKKLLKQRGLE